MRKTTKTETKPLVVRTNRHLILDATRQEQVAIQKRLSTRERTEILLAAIAERKEQTNA